MYFMIQKSSSVNEKRLTNRIRKYEFFAKLQTQYKLNFIKFSLIFYGIRRSQQKYWFRTMYRYGFFLFCFKKYFVHSLVSSLTKISIGNMSKYLIKFNIWNFSLFRCSLKYFFSEIHVFSIVSCVKCILDRIFIFSDICSLESSTLQCSFNEIWQSKIMK